ncbi:hypothetical protein HYR69_08275 [Candidatus Sumerlaeota bacterium]|nr:hypothetical protein [Candidatus Sumerlaeota bacterium]MBI3736465.1 hypothetical protein [Candidatus Sumerlaeota bacterium]
MGPRQFIDLAAMPDGFLFARNAMEAGGVEGGQFRDPDHFIDLDEVMIRVESVSPAPMNFVSLEGAKAFRVAAAR